MRAARVGIIGGSYAGLAAALMLRRHRRSVLVFDGGPPRNIAAQTVHGYLGLPAVSAAELHKIAHRQVLDVDGQICAEWVTGVDRRDGNFQLQSAAGESWLVERLLLATGVQDAYPNIDNFEAFYGRSVFSCPHCDAYEVRDKPVAIISWNPETLDFVREMSQWTDRITVVTDEHAPDLSADDESVLTGLRVPVLRGAVERFEGESGDLTALRFADGSTLPVEAAFFNLARVPRVEHPTALGCRLNEAGYVQVDAHQRTSAWDVWCAGDITGGESLVAVAAAQGVRAAIDIDRTLDGHN